MQSNQNSKDSSDSSLKKSGQTMNISLFTKPSIMKVYSLSILISLMVGKNVIFHFVIFSRFDTKEGKNSEDSQ